MPLFPSLQAKLARYEEVERQLQDPAVLSDAARLQQLQREHGGLAKIALRVREFNRIEAEIAAVQKLIAEESDPAAKEYATEELNELQQRYDRSRTELEEIVLAGDALTRDSLIMEIRAGTGGEEAALFARDLYDMYRRLCDKHGWKTETLDFSPSEMGGVREVVFSVSGEGAYRRLQFESGGHRVQRVPDTETQGRVHTSAATVAVLPEVTDVEVEIREQDLQIETMRAGGPGGQKVNKTSMNCPSPRNSSTF